MQRIPPRSITLRPLWRYRRRLAPSAVSATSIPTHTSSPGPRCASPRQYSSLFQKLSDSVASKVAQLTEEAWLADEKLVTEARRKIKPQRVSHQSLAERLTAQRDVKQHLVPVAVKVDKSRQYVEFTWPPEAFEVMRRLSEEAVVATATAAAQSGVSLSSNQSSAPEPEAADPPASSSLPSSTVSQPRRPVFQHDPSLTCRTRALAEYLRAFTPSTDGALGSADIVIYGRRGLTITKVIPIGNYALRFVFSDEHAGGIYSYEYLFYLTGPATKYGLMRAYIRDLKRKRKSRDPPRRAPSKKYAKVVAPPASTSASHDHAR